MGRLLARIHSCAWSRKLPRAACSSVSSSQSVPRVALPPQARLESTSHSCPHNTLTKLPTSSNAAATPQGQLLTVPSDRAVL